MSSGCGCKEVYIDFLILLIPTPLVYICSFFLQQCKIICVKRMFYCLTHLHTFSSVHKILDSQGGKQLPRGANSFQGRQTVSKGGKQLQGEKTVPRGANSFQGGGGDAPFASPEKNAYKADALPTELPRQLRLAGSNKGNTDVILSSL